MGTPSSAATCPVSVPSVVARWASSCAGRSSAPQTSRRGTLRTCAITRDDRFAPDLQQLNIENNSGVWRHDDLSGVVSDGVVPKSEPWWNDEPASRAAAHADHALLKSVDQRSNAGREYQRPPDVDRAVESGSIEQIASVVHRDRVTPQRSSPYARVTGDIAQP